MYNLLAHDISIIQCVLYSHLPKGKQMRPTDTCDQPTTPGSSHDPLVETKKDFELFLAQELPPRLAALGIDLSVFEDINVMEPTYIDRVRRS